MSLVSPPEKAGMPLWDLIAKECDSEDTDLINQKIQETWMRIAKRFGQDGEDVAQEALCQLFKKASQGKVEKPLQYAAKSAKNIARDLQRRQGYALAYQQARSGEWLGWEPEGEQTQQGSSAVVKKLPIAAPRSQWDQPDLMEVLQLLREMVLDSTGHLLIREACGERLEMTSHQESKFRVRLRQKVKAEKREYEDSHLIALEPYL
jgi:DNA-directed RNA polymerase specialized sigma24 family protein